jgi:uncharacterized protein (DUF305 family)
MSPADAAAPSSDEVAFVAETGTIMSNMVKNMGVKPSGNVAEDFVVLMQPHHQAAIEMAEAELRYGQNERLRHIVEEITAQQQHECAATNLSCPAC